MFILNMPVVKNNTAGMFFIGNMKIDNQSPIMFNGMKIRKKRMRKATLSKEPIDMNAILKEEAENRIKMYRSIFNIYPEESEIEYRAIKTERGILKRIFTKIKSLIKIK